MKIFDEIFLQHNPRFAVPECPQIHYNASKVQTGRSPLSMTRYRYRTSLTG
jgi:hypothetical protein